ncbi:Ubiquitin--protein ligase [Handroanthus impetiginosus]|uniref:RING-type E3 ubiquitin transferase n=1 Tax=Handroanthus impetiginosus TaxID=429701 RepID=A0A2G9G313_9LAMI|nr:Ubiquitin--protein ligase [Handroanthus impetiginosus]
MSSGYTHWCYQCDEPIHPLGRDSICPYCNGGFIQQLREFAGAHTVGISGSGHSGPLGIFGAYAAFLRDRLAGRGPTLDVRPFPGMIPERRIVIRPVPLCPPCPPGPLIIFHGHPPLVGVPVHEPYGYFFNGAPGMSQPMEQRQTDYNDFHMETQLLDQLSMNDDRRVGPPPAARAAIDALPTIRISQRHLNTDAHCPVCQDKFTLGSEARQLPCDHIYHSNCIVPWLVEHNTCPVCRFELPPHGPGSSRPNLNRRTGNPRRSRRRDSHSQSQRSQNPFSFLWRSNSANQHSRHH